MQRPGVVATVFLAPFLILFFVFRVWPIVSAVSVSFQNIVSIGDGEFIGFGNYQALMSDGMFYDALRNTALYTGGTLVLLVPIPLILAAVLQSGSVKAPGAFRTIFFLPLLAGLVVVGVVFQLILSQNGIMNAGLGLFGVPRLAWLDRPELALPALLIVAVWRWTGINMVYFSTGLAAIPDDLYEAAVIDGASGLRRFLHISVPLSKPIILFVTVLTLIGGFQLFVEPFILWAQSGGVGPNRAGMSIVVMLYRTAFTSFRLGYASAIGVVLALIIMVVAVLQLRAFGFFGGDEEKRLQRRSRRMSRSGTGASA
jgi:arabinosaccharide transport system permease protein